VPVVVTSWTLPSTPTTIDTGPVGRRSFISLATPRPYATVPRPTPSLSRIGSSFLACALVPLIAPMM
jgi:hypothetical protein